MSFILDALKKSEADRQENASPGIADVPTAVNPASAPRWLWIIVALLGVNLVVLMVVLLRPGDVEPAVPVTASIEPPAMAAEIRPEPVAAATSIPAGASAGAARPTPSAADSSLEGSTVNEDTVETPRQSAPEPTPESAPVAAAPAPAEEPEPETLLTFNDLRASGNVSLPDLHVDLHVFSDNPAERFVFINMNQYRENATMSEGPRVQRITSEGVILEYVGTTFLLPRE